MSTEESKARQRIDALDNQVPELKCQKASLEKEQCFPRQSGRKGKKASRGWRCCLLDTGLAAVKETSKKRSKELEADLEATRARVDALDEQVSELIDNTYFLEEALAMHDMDHEQHCERFEILDLEVFESQEDNQFLEKEKAG